MGKRGADPYGKPLTTIELFRRLNQQFNDNCCRDRYHKINEKRRGVNTMNLKEAFRFQNKLQSMMTDAQSILGNNGNITKVQNTYLRHKVMAEAEDEVTRATAIIIVAGLNAAAVCVVAEIGPAFCS